MTMDKKAARRDMKRHDKMIEKDSATLDERDAKRKYDVTKDREMTTKQKLEKKE